MEEQRERIRRLERMVLILALGLLLSLVGAAGAVAVSLQHEGEVTAEVGAFEELFLAGGVHLEVSGSDLRITLPDDGSGVFLLDPDGTEIARLGGPTARQLGD